MVYVYIYIYRELSMWCVYIYIYVYTVIYMVYICIVLYMAYIVCAYESNLCIDMRGIQAEGSNCARPCSKDLILLRSILGSPCLKILVYIYR